MGLKPGWKCPGFSGCQRTARFSFLTKTALAEETARDSKGLRAPGQEGVWRRALGCFVAMEGWQGVSHVGRGSPGTLASLVSGQRCVSTGIVHTQSLCQSRSQHERTENVLGKVGRLRPTSAISQVWFQASHFSICTGCNTRADTMSSAASRC